ncbi:MAG: molybdopterin-dependent oxidoreductase, partial [Thermoleophilia bacterium]|nr:molybdopterin-dependent oxidoreductase [Thermoleophilia bacterium]
MSGRGEARPAAGSARYPGPSGTQLDAYPPKERWDDWVELDSKAWPERVERRSLLVPTTCFNCESACGLLAYVDPETLTVRKFEGNPEHPGSRGRNCAKGPATLNQITDPDRILHPLRRAGARGEGRWERVSWDDVLDELAGRIRQAITEGRPNSVMYHVGRPGEDGFTERVLAAWGVDGHNSHTNVCSSSGRAGYHFWMGLDRPSPDHANAEVILLVSAHLESGHYFNPHAQRVMEGKANGAKLVVLDTRLSNTATHADHWLAPRPGTEAAILLAIARHLIETGSYDREFVRRFWNWQEYLACEHPDGPQTFEEFERRLADTYAEFTFELVERESGVSAGTIEQVAGLVASAGTRLSTHTWRSATAGNLGGWQVARCLFLLNALLGAVATPGGTFPNAWTKFVPRPIHTPPHPETWNELTWPEEYPLAIHELSFLLPHFLREGRGTLDVYFTRVYNPVWTNPDGFSWIEMLSDERRVGLHVALTPTWSETAFLADYVLPMGHGSERHDLHSYEQYDGQWVGFRQPVLRAAAERLGREITDTREINPGEVWEENEFWIELSWRIDPDGELGIRRHFESREHPGEKLSVDEYYAYIFEHSV